MRNLGESAARIEIRERIETLRLSDQRRWGTLRVEEMMAHVRQAYVLNSVAREAALVDVPMPRGLFKFLALGMPVRWPKTTQTVPALKREAMPPADDFDLEHGRLRASLEGFLGYGNNTGNHPMFGAMRHRDWMRWGYLHADHHLRQFGR